MKERYGHQRLIRTRSSRAAPRRAYPAQGEYTMWPATQIPHILRLLMAAFVFGIPEAKLRVIAPEVGGGFGSKIDVYAEYGLLPALAEKLGLPVKWVEERSRGLRRDDPRARRRPARSSSAPSRRQDDGAAGKRLANMGGDSSS